MRIIAIVFILMWVSHVPYLFPHPFQPHEGIDRLARDATQVSDDIKEIVGIKDKTATDLTNAMMHDLQLLWIKEIIFITIGITSGLLILARNKFGRIMTLSFSIYLIASSLFTIFSSGIWRYRLSVTWYRTMYKHFPVQTVHQIITQVVLLLTIIIIMTSFIRAKTKSEITA